MQKIIFIAGKGGVGKTTIAVNVAVLWAQQGWNVGLLDANIHSPAIPRMLGIHPQGIVGLVEGIEPASPMEGLKVVSMALFIQNQEAPIAWRGPIKQGVIKQLIADSHWGDLDYLIVDLPAGTGDEAMSAVHFLKGAAGALLVATPQALALREVRRTATFFLQHHVPLIGLVENMAEFSCPHCDGPLTPFGEGTGQQTAEDLSMPLIARIPFDPQVTRCADMGKPFVTSLSPSPAAATLREVGQQCQELINERMRFTLLTQIVYKD
jgi:ATP-binding protein involved in chromosome partitioning